MHPIPAQLLIGEQTAFPALAKVTKTAQAALVAGPEISFQSQFFASLDQNPQRADVAFSDGLATPESEYPIKDEQEPQLQGVEINVEQTGKPQVEPVSVAAVDRMLPTRPEPASNDAVVAFQASPQIGSNPAVSVPYAPVGSVQETPEMRPELTLGQGGNPAQPVPLDNPALPFPSVVVRTPEPPAVVDVALNRRSEAQLPQNAKANVQTEPVMVTNVVQRSIQSAHAMTEAQRGISSHQLKTPALQSAPVASHNAISGVPEAAGISRDGQLSAPVRTADRGLPTNHSTPVALRIAADPPAETMRHVVSSMANSLPKEPAPAPKRFHSDVSVRIADPATVPLNHRMPQQSVPGDRNVNATANLTSGHIAGKPATVFPESRSAPVKFSPDIHEPALIAPASSSNDPPLQRAEAMRLPVAQTVDFLTRQPDRPVLISLSPEELGKVRMALTASDTGVTLVITTERPETMELMRRHIDQLSQEFRRLGYENIGFEFRNGGSGSGEPNARLRKFDGTSQDEPVAPPNSVEPKPAKTSGLDLRL